jgi:hypothetical protein
MATATLLAQPRFTVFDANGNPVAGGLVHTYIPGGTTPKATWQDAAETIPNANPVPLDSAGSCLLYGSGSYQLTVTDALGVAVPGYSGVTTDTLAAVTTETVRALAAEAANTTGIAANTAAIPTLGKFSVVQGPAGAARVAAVVYTNISTRPIFVSITATTTAATLVTFTVSGLVVDIINQPVFPAVVAVRGMVPAGGAYRLDISNVLTGINWCETV